MCFPQSTEIWDLTWENEMITKMWFLEFPCAQSQLHLSPWASISQKHQITANLSALGRLHHVSKGWAPRGLSVCTICLSLNHRLAHLACCFTRLTLAWPTQTHVPQEQKLSFVFSARLTVSTSKLSSLSGLPFHPTYSSHFQQRIELHVPALPQFWCPKSTSNPTIHLLLNWKPPQRVFGITSCCWAWHLSAKESMVSGEKDEKRCLLPSRGVLF